ncbi:MAG: hypothetical protein HQK78_13390 [Desulfobacterales bacterium]|nr:hypothetical protein [Desulfobacterales bacterium]
MGTRASSIIQIRYKKYCRYKRATPKSILKGVIFIKFFIFLNKFLKKLLIFLSITIVTVIAVVSGLLFSLPYIVPTPKFKTFIEEQVTDTIKSPAKIRELNFSWEKGINIFGFQIEDEALFSKDPIFAIDKIKLTINLNDLLSRIVNLDFMLDGIRCQYIRNIDGKTNIEAMLSKMEETKKTEKKKTKFFFVIPVDLIAKVYIDNIIVKADDKLQKQKILLDKAYFHIDIPKFSEKPISVNVFSNISLNGKVISPFDLKISVKNLCTPGGIISLNQASCDLKSELLGTKIFITGFVQNQLLSFDSKIEGVNFALSGLNISNFKIFNQGSFDIKKDRLDLKNGGLYLLKKGQVFWNGVIDNIKSKTPNIDFTLKSIFFELNEIINLLKNYLPDTFQIRKAPANLSISNINISGKQFKIDDLMLNIPDISFKLKDQKELNIQKLTLSAKSKVKLNNTKPLDINIEGLNASISAFDMFKVDLNADLTNTGKSKVKTNGNMILNLQLLEKYIPYIKTTGNVKLEWDVSGRIPNEKELSKFKDISSFNIETDLGFLDNLKTLTHLKDVCVDFKRLDKKRYKVQKISTVSPIKNLFETKSGKGELSANISIDRIDEIPFIKIKEPLKLNVSYLITHDYLKRIKILESINIYPFNIKQSVDASLYGIDKLIKRKFKPPISSWLNYLGCDIKGSVDFDNPDLSLFKSDLKVRGNINSLVELYLRPFDSIKTTSIVSGKDIDIQLGNKLILKGLNPDFELSKTFSLAKEEAKKENAISLLSKEVMELNPEFTRIKENKSIRVNHSITLKSLNLLGGKFPISINNSFLDFNLNEGLPIIEQFQLDILNGTVKGNMAILKTEMDSFYLQADLAFSGVEDLSGNISIAIPFNNKIKTFFDDFKLNVSFTHISSLALQRILYALDPYESNEAISSQRKLLNTGYPRWINLNIKNGNLSLDGEIEAKGIRVSIPKLERLNISNVGTLNRLEEYLGVFIPVNKILHVFTKSELPSF